MPRKKKASQATAETLSAAAAIAQQQKPKPTAAQLSRQDELRARAQQIDPFSVFKSYMQETEFIECFNPNVIYEVRKHIDGREALRLGYLPRDFMRELQVAITESMKSVKKLDEDKINDAVDQKIKEVLSKMGRQDDDGVMHSALNAISFYVVNPKISMEADCDESKAIPGSTIPLEHIARLFNDFLPKVTEALTKMESASARVSFPSESGGTDGGDDRRSHGQTLQ